MILYTGLHDRHLHVQHLRLLFMRILSGILKPLALQPMHAKSAISCVKLVMPGMEELSINSAHLEFMPRH